MKRLINILPIFALILIINACQEDPVVNRPELPVNPFDGLEYPVDDIIPVDIDPNSFLGLYNNIFSVSCAQQACHDGAFEPDFRTVNSAYNTLVFAGVVKNTDDEYFDYRVLPGDTNLSWLHERITTDDPVLGRMPLYDELEQEKIDLITNWILEGAPDFLGNTQDEPNNYPSGYGVIAYVGDTTGFRIDDQRGNNIYQPFMAPANTLIDIWLGLYDDAVYPPFFTYMTIQYSTDPLNYDNSPEFNMILDADGHWAPVFTYYDDAPYFFHHQFDTGQYNVGDQIFIRINVNDGEHAEPTELPEVGSTYYEYSYTSFIIQ